MTTVSSIIVNWNGEKYLDACLDTVFKQTLSHKEIILVDNASSDRSIEIVKKKYPSVIIIQNKDNLGFAVGNNIGFKYSTGKYIAMINNDTELHPQWTEKLVEFMENHENVAGASGKTYSLTEREKLIWTTPKIDHRSGKAIWVKSEVSSRPVDYLLGHGVIFRRSVIEKIGFLDEEYWAYYEETDLCARIIRSGFKLFYIPEAIIWHKEMGSSSWDFNYYMMARNRIRFVLKNFDLSYFPIFIFYWTQEMLREVAKNYKTGAKNYNLLLIKALFWNLIQLPKTIKARNRDLKKLSLKKSYNKSLPLRNCKSDGFGGLTYT